jgi:hypothetical protein
MDEPAEAVQRLIDASAEGAMTLTVLSGLDLCVLGATGQSLFDTAVAVAWGAQSDHARAEVQSDMMDGLAGRELLFPAGEPGSYTMAPELSIVMAARADPTFALATAIEGTDIRSVKMFGLGDENRPLQAVVVESPMSAPKGNYKNVGRIGPLGWFYRYMLASPADAADMLVRWTTLDLPRGRKGRVITTFRHPPGSGLSGDVVTMRGKSRITKLLRNGIELDVAELPEVVGGMITAAAAR